MDRPTPEASLVPEAELAARQRSTSERMSGAAPTPSASLGSEASHDLLVRWLNPSDTLLYLYRCLDVEPGGAVRGWLGAVGADEDALLDFVQLAALRLRLVEPPPPRSKVAASIRLDPRALAEGIEAVERLRALGELGLGLRMRVRLRSIGPNAAAARIIEAYRSRRVSGGQLRDLQCIHASTAEDLQFGVPGVWLLEPDRSLRVAERLVLEQAFAVPRLGDLGSSPDVHPHLLRRPAALALLEMLAADEEIADTAPGRDEDHGGARLVRAGRSGGFPHRMP